MMQEIPQTSPTADESHVDRFSQLRGDINTLTNLLSTLHVEEQEARNELQSLSYAADLTRDEAERRKRANSELHTAYQETTADSDSSIGDTQRMKSELLNAKRDAANITYEVAQLEFELKQLREEREEKEKGKALRAAVSPRSPRMRSPRLSSLGANSGAVNSPGSTRPSRLIGDVDALVHFENDRQAGEYLACRLGVSASGQMALYSYAGAAPLLYLDDSTARMGELKEADVKALKENLATVDLQIAGEKYGMSGLRESIGASMELVQDASRLPLAKDEAPGFVA